MNRERIAQEIADAIAEKYPPARTKVRTLEYEARWETEKLGDRVLELLIEMRAIEKARDDQPKHSEQP